MLSLNWARARMSSDRINKSRMWIRIGSSTETRQCEASRGKEGEELEMVKVCQVTSFRLVCSTQFSVCLWLHFILPFFLWLPLIPECLIFFSITIHFLSYHLSNPSSCFLPPSPPFSSFFYFLSLYICFKGSEGHGSPAHSRSASIRSAASCDGGAAALRAPGSAESSPRRTLHPPSTAGALQDGWYTCTLITSRVSCYHISFFAMQVNLLK